MSNFIFQVLIVTTPEELERGKETYATMSRTIDMPVQPYVGMNIFFNPNKNDERLLRLRETLGIASDALRVESISVFVGNIDGSNPDLISAHIKLTEIFEPNLSQFKARIHLFEQFYGFERI